MDGRLHAVLGPYVTWCFERRPRLSPLAQYALSFSVSIAGCLERSLVCDQLCLRKGALEDWQAMGWTVTKPPYNFLGLWDCYDLPPEALSTSSVRTFARSSLDLYKRSSRTGDVDLERLWHGTLIEFLC